VRLDSYGKTLYTQRVAQWRKKTSRAGLTAELTADWTTCTACWSPYRVQHASRHQRRCVPINVKLCESCQIPFSMHKHGCGTDTVRCRCDIEAKKRAWYLQNLAVVCDTFVGHRAHYAAHIRKRMMRCVCCQKTWMVGTLFPRHVRQHGEIAVFYNLDRKRPDTQPALFTFWLKGTLEKYPRPFALKMEFVCEAALYDCIFESCNAVLSAADIKEHLLTCPAGEAVRSHPSFCWES